MFEKSGNLTTVEMATEQIIPAMLDALPIPCLLIQENLRVLQVNRAARVLNTQIGHELIGQKIAPDLWITRDVLGAIDRERYTRTVMRTNEPLRDLVREMVYHDGTHQWVQFTVTPVHIHGGERAALYTLADISPQMEERRLLLRHVLQMQALIEYSPLPSCILDEEGRHEVVNAVYCSLTGYTIAELIGKPFMLMHPPDRRGAMLARHRAILQQRGQHAGDFEMITKTGNRCVVRTSTAVFMGEDERLHRAVFVEDRTRLLQEQEQLRALAAFDALTGLANRVSLTESLAVAIAEAQGNGRHVGVLFLDFDGFKAVNDRYGHAAGDAVLVAIAQRLRDQTRNEATVARYGGDEFVVVLPRLATAEGAMSAARSLLAACVAPLSLPWGDLRAGVSIGVAVGPDDGTDPGRLIDHADAAMYAAKESGKSRVVRHGMVPGASILEG